MNDSGSATMRNARSNARATSRWQTKRTLPCFVNAMRTGNPASPLTTLALVAVRAGPEQHRNGAARR